MGKVDCNGGLVMVVLNRLKYCGKYKGKLSDVRPSYVYRDQEKVLGFPGILLADSRLFNGLRRIQIKKFFPVSVRVSSCEPTSQTASSLPTHAGRSLLAEFVIAGHYSADFCLSNKMSDNSDCLVAGDSTRLTELRPLGISRRGDHPFAKIHG